MKSIWRTVKSILRKIWIFIFDIALDPFRLFGFTRRTISFIKDVVVFLRQRQQSDLKNSFSFSFYPILSDKYKAGGVAKGDYFHQDLLVSQRIFANNPIKHVDIGSRVDGFIAHVAAYREIEVLVSVQ